MLRKFINDEIRKSLQTVGVRSGIFLTVLSKSSCLSTRSPVPSYSHVSCWAGSKTCISHLHALFQSVSL